VTTRHFAISELVQKARTFGNRRGADYSRRISVYITATSLLALLLLLLLLDMMRHNCQPLLVCAVQA
jgi:hypothetical protein